MHLTKEEDSIVVVHQYRIEELSDEEFKEGDMSELSAEDSDDNGLLGYVNEVEATMVWHRHGEALKATAAQWWGDRM
jgi:hypothetical protein